MRDAIVFTGLSWEMFNVPERISMALASLGSRVLHCEPPQSVLRGKAQVMRHVADGIHSRIEDTVDDLVDRLQVGNIYVNRNMIGAVVGVQPFGGFGLSGTGPKAGGPHYLARFATEQTVTIL